MTRPLAVQLYTVRDLADRDATIRRLADIGYDAVEHYRPTDDPEGLRAVLDDVGMTVWGMHCWPHSDELEPIVRAARTLGTDRLVVPGGIAAEEFTTVEGVERTAALLSGMRRRVAEAGIRLGYHNHWWEIEPVLDGRHAIEVLADMLDPSIFLEVDTYWAAVGGADLGALLEHLGDRVEALHIKDGPVVKGEPNTAVGQGAMPVGDVIAAARSDAQLIVEFDSCATDLMTAVADSRAYLASWLERG